MYSDSKELSNETEGMPPMKQAMRSQGFSVIEIVLVIAVVVVIGLVGFNVYNAQQAANKQQQTTSDTEVNKEADVQTTPESTLVETPTPTPETTPEPTPTPAPSPAPTPKPWDIVHPNTDTCLNNQTKTVYVSESNGAAVYNSDYSATSAKVDYKTAKTGTCIYLSNGTGWIRYGTETQLRWQDVSITAP